jgi:hypothetical protein
VEGQQAPLAFGWLFEGPEGLRQFNKAADFIRPVLELHLRMAREQPDKYTMTALYTSPAVAPSAQPVRVLTEDDIKRMRSEARADPRCVDEHWFVLLVRAVEKHYGILAAPSAQEPCPSCDGWNRAYYAARSTVRAPVDAKPVAWRWVNPDGTVEFTTVAPELDGDLSTMLALELGRKAEPLYLSAQEAAPQQGEATTQERERCALLCDDLAWIMENGGGDPEPGGRLRQAARNIRDPDHQPMRLDAMHAAREDAASLQQHDQQEGAA